MVPIHSPPEPSPDPNTGEWACTDTPVLPLSSTPKWGPVTSSAYLFLQAAHAQDPAERGSLGEKKGQGEPIPHRTS